MKTSQNILKWVTSPFVEFVSAVPSSKKSSKILNTIWLIIAGICFLGGLILAIFYPIFESPYFIIRFWYTWSFICGISFLPRIIKPIVKVTKGAAKFGKFIEYEETSATRIGFTDVYEVRKEKKNLGKLFGWIFAFIFSFIQLILVCFLGVVATIIRALLTVKELSKVNT